MISNEAKQKYEFSSLDRILKAVENDDKNIINEIGKMGATAFTELIHHRTATDKDSILHVAARCENLDIVRVLLRRVKDHPQELSRDFLDASNQYKETAFHIAFTCDLSIALQMSNLLIDAGSNPWIKNHNDETPFFLACSNGVIDSVTRILQLSKSSMSPDALQALIEGQSAEGLSALSIATTRGHSAIVSALQSYMHPHSSHARAISPSHSGSSSRSSSSASATDMPDTPTASPTHSRLSRILNVPWRISPPSQMRPHSKSYASAPLAAAADEKGGALPLAIAPSVHDCCRRGDLTTLQLLPLSSAVCLSSYCFLLNYY